MDRTEQNLERKKQREITKVDEINSLQDLWEDKLQLKWSDILLFGWNAGFSGYAKIRCEDLFIEEAHEKFLEQLKL